MDSGAYFVGRHELLGWINTTLQLNLQKIEETASGAVACQIMDALHPGTVPMKKVDFNVKNEYDFINNYKVLQETFNKLGVERHIDVAKLVKARPLDNMEFMQWLKSYFDGQMCGQALAYDAPARRQLCKSGDVKQAAAGASVKPGSAAGRLRPSTSEPDVAKGSRLALARGSPPASSRPHSSDTGRLAEMAQQLAEMRLRVENAEKERDFYYSKLRDVELLCSTPVVADMPVTKRVEAILFAATMEDGREALRDAQREFVGEALAESLVAAPPQ